MTQEYTWFTDPGHGWLRVPVADIKGHPVSAYSFTDGVYAYLEEDCDAGYLLDQYDTHPTIHTDERSFIRDLPRVVEYREAGLL